MFVVVIATLIIQSVVKAEDYVHSPIQYQSQTDSGTYNFGYDTGLFGSHQFHQEYKDDSGQVRGRYGYTDPYGKLRLVHYTSGPQGYEVISDTEADKAPKSSERSSPDPVITNVVERYSAVPKPITKPRYTKPIALPPTSPKLTVSRPTITTTNLNNDNRRTYIAGRDYGEVIVSTHSIAPRTILSPVERLRAATLTGRSIDGNRVGRSVAPDRYKPEFKPPEGYTKCTCV